MKNQLAACMILLFLAAPIAAADFKTAIDRPGVDISTVRKLMEKGQVLIIDEKPGGGLELVTAGIIINAPPEKVYETLTQYDKYFEYMPSTVGCEVIKDDGNTKDVRYKIEFKFSVLGWKVEYVLRQTFVPNKEIRWHLVSSKDNKVKATHGAWQLFSAPGGKTAAFYSVYSDMKSISWVIRKTFEAEPSMELSVNASTCVMVLKAVKSRMEIPGYAPNLKK